MAIHPARLFIAMYLDADIDVKLAGAIRDEGFDAISAREIGNDFLLKCIRKSAILTQNDAQRDLSFE